MGFATEKIRNIAIAGHVGTGKTTLVEQMLFTGDVIPKFEPVDSGRTVSDFAQEEIERKLSIHTSLTHLKWKDVKINILDTPGSGDFVGEVVSAFRTCECGLMVMSGRAGVQIETIKLWRRLNNRQKPRLVYINRMEEEHSDFSKVLQDIKDKFQSNIVPITVPMGAGGNFKGVIDIVENKAYLMSPDGKKETASDIPAEFAAEAEDYRMKLLESAAEGDDALMEKFFAEETLSPEEIRLGITKGLGANKLVPVFCGSALRNSGVVSLLNFIESSVPSPAGAPETLLDEEGNGTAITINPGEPAACYVVKTSIDQFAGRMSYIKVVTGKISADSELMNEREHKKERVSKVYTANGKKLEEAGELSAGDIGILTKLAHTNTNDTLCSPDKPVHFAPLNLPNPVHSVAVSAFSKKDEDKLNMLLQKASEEDFTFRLSYNQETKETVISGMGELHLNMILDRIKESQKIELETKVPKVAYRETITKPANAEYTHKKQSGGHGQYGKVLIDVKPLSRGEYYHFENGIRGMAVSKGYIPGIEKGLHDAMESGVLAGYPVVDVSVTLLDGKEHPVDSSEMSFRLASKGALKSAMENAGPLLLEPVMKLTVFIEERYLGDILSDLSGKRGKVLSQEPIGGGIMEVDALVPQAELLRYAIDLKSMTSGTGSFEMEFSNYETISGKIADAVIHAAKASGHDNKD